MIAPIYLACAFCLDLAIGDPPWLPHPVRIIGKGIGGMETFLRRTFKDDGRERAAGVILVVAIVPGAAVAAFFIGRLLLSFSLRPLVVIGALAFIYLVSTTLALRGLINSTRLVIRAVREKSLTAARGSLAMIVGRDTDNLGEEAILRATIETLAENLSDGFVAPLFYLVVGGLPAAIAYKAVNTLDSMVGYKDARYIRFGWAAARLDDVANYIPARLTALSLTAAAFICSLADGASQGLRAARDSFMIMRRDGRNHTSPNSGLPEAAMAGALGIRLGGPSIYGGAIVDKPYIGDERGADYLRSADRAITLVAAAASLMVLLALALVTLGRVL
ncbi:MAG: adenosylcobinamide-phosphate synthase CbiB [Syntrophorhabdales bacterium]